jgi:predicted transcriptional regulator
VYRALASLGRGPSPVQELSRPAVPIRQSVQREYVVCLECGFRAQALRRHLRVQHGFEVADYRARWKLSPDHVLVAPAYSAQRSAMAKELGFGRKPAPVEPPPAPSRRGRPRRPPAN